MGFILGSKMEKNKIYLIYSRSPTLGRTAFPWVIQLITMFQPYKIR